MYLSRRRYLSGAAGALAMGVAGCVEDVSVEDAMAASDMFHDVQLTSETGKLTLEIAFDKDYHGYYEVCRYDPALEMTTCNSYRNEGLIEKTTLVTQDGGPYDATIIDGERQRAEWTFEDSYGDFETGEYIITVPMRHSGNATLSFDVESNSNGYQIAENTTDVNETS